MKKVFWFICLIVVMALTVGFTWDGELDPNELHKWKVIKFQPISQCLAWVYIKNPDQESPIKIVAQAVNHNRLLLGYRYFKNGQPYVYAFDSMLDKYVRMELSEEEQASSMGCHKKEANDGQKAI